MCAYAKDQGVAAAQELRPSSSIVWVSKSPAGQQAWHFADDAPATACAADVQSLSQAQQPQDTAAANVNCAPPPPPHPTRAPRGRGGGVIWGAGGGGGARRSSYTGQILEVCSHLRQMFVFFFAFFQRILRTHIFFSTSDIALYKWMQQVRANNATSKVPQGRPTGRRRAGAAGISTTCTIPITIPPQKSALSALWPSAANPGA